VNRTETPAAGNRFAQGFEISQNSNGFTINLLSPWMDNFSTTYAYNLVFNDSLKQVGKVNSQTIKIPLKRVAIMSTTHLALIESLGEMETVLGISERQYVNSQAFWEHHQRNAVVEIGYENTLDMENVIKLMPDAVFVYGLSQGISQTVERLVKMGIPVVFVSEFNEVHPLAKLEWLRFMACFFNKLDMADSIFNQKVAHYNQIREMVVDVPIRPTVLVGLPWKDVWNVPGNNTVTATFIDDAGGRYLFSHLNQKVNYPLGIEEVFLQAGQADYWIHVGFANSLADIAASDNRFVNFKAFSMGNVFNNNKIQNNVGGNDYLESGIMNPEVVLKDLISVFHPEIFQEYVEIYYKKML
jgi:iron complex transport system substrate-binding protein